MQASTTRLSVLAPASGPLEVWPPARWCAASALAAWSYTAAPARGRSARHRRLRDPHGDFGRNILAAPHAAQSQADRINAPAFDAYITTYVQMAAYHAVIAAYATGQPDPGLPYWPVALKNLTARFLSNDDFP